MAKGQLPIDNDLASAISCELTNTVIGCLFDTGTVQPCGDNHRVQSATWREALKRVLLDVGLPGRTGRLRGELAHCSAVTDKALRKLFFQVPESKRHNLIPALLEVAADLNARGLSGIAAGKALHAFADEMRQKLNS